MDVPRGYERSFKTLDGKLLTNRYLLGINLANLAHSDLITICRQLKMLEQYLSTINSEYPNANLAFIGFEDNEPYCVYRIYLEVWDRLKGELATKKNKRQPALPHLGFKWGSENNVRRVISRCTCYPLLTTREIIARMSSIYASGHDQTSFQIAREIVNYAARREKEHSFIHVEVTEDGNTRNSFDLTLYSVMVRLSEIEPWLRKLRDRYAIPTEKFDNLYERVGKRLFGHLSSRVRRQRGDFLTIYFE